MPHVRVGEPAFNAERTLELARQAYDETPRSCMFPELGLAAYSIEDLFHQEALLDGVSSAVERIVAASTGLRPVIVVGAPLQAERGLFNAAIVIHRGRVLGAVPKSYLPEYREYYEKRQFRAARDLVGDELQLLGATVPFSPDLAVRLPRPAGVRAPRRDLRGRVGRRSRRAATAHWPARPCSRTCRRATSRSARPTTAGCLPGAVGTGDRRLTSTRPPGIGESTTDLAWDGQALIYENGQLLRRVRALCRRRSS